MVKTPNGFKACDGAVTGVCVVGGAADLEGECEDDGIMRAAARHPRHTRVCVAELNQQLDSLGMLASASEFARLVGAPRQRWAGDHQVGCEVATLNAWAGRPRHAA